MTPLKCVKAKVTSMFGAEMIDICVKMWGVNVKVIRKINTLEKYRYLKILLYNNKVFVLHHFPPLHLPKDTLAGQLKQPTTELPTS